MKNRLQETMKDAMRAKDKLRLETVRGLISAIKYEEIQRSVSPLPENACLEILQREIKKRRESLDFAEKAQRPELVTQARAEIAVIEAFLPQQLSAQKIEELIVGMKSANPGVNMGMAMKQLKEQYAGQYDGKLASEIAKRLLG